MHCYCLSGLGADHRLFSRLNLPGVSLHELAWLPPQAEESIAQYAARMNTAIHHDNPILLGVSFGGMMAIEIAKLYPSATVILVSSIRDCHQRPTWMTICGWLRLRRLVPTRDKANRDTARDLPLRKWLSPFENYFQSLETSEDKALYLDFRRLIDRRFVRWAIGEILQWKNEWVPESMFHLHGGRDRIFPLPQRAVTHFLPDGGHFMVFNRAEWVGRQVAAILQTLPAAPKNLR